MQSAIDHADFLRRQRETRQVKISQVFFRELYDTARDAYDSQPVIHSWSRVSNGTLHLLSSFWNPALFKTSLRSRGDSVRRPCRSTRALVLKPRTTEQMVNRALNPIPCLALRIGSREVPFAKLERARDRWSGGLPLLFTSSTPTRRARPKNASARESVPRGPVRAVSTTYAWNGSWWHPDEFPYV